MAEKQKAETFIKLVPVVANRSVIPVNHELMDNLDQKINNALQEHGNFSKKMEMARRRKILWKKITEEGDLLDRISFIFDYIDTFF